jgi:hypothetical protein
MQLDLDSLYVGDKLTTITLEAIGDDKVRVNHQSWTDAVVIRDPADGSGRRSR